MNREYELLADSVEWIMKTPKPKAPKWYGAMAPTVVVPPVSDLEHCFLEGDHDMFWAPDQFGPDILPNVNVAMLTDQSARWPGVYAFNWISTANKSQRRMAKLTAKHMVALFSAGLKDGKWYEISVDLYSWINGRWRDAIGNRVGGQGCNGGVMGHRNSLDEEHEKIQTLYSAGLMMRYCYSMALTDPEEAGCMSARLFAYPDTVRFLLKTREIGNAARRRALVHLVRRHTRRRRKAHAVKSHLRGEYRCRWAGLDVSVLPSQYDAEIGAGAVTERLRSDGLLRWIAPNEEARA